MIIMDTRAGYRTNDQQTQTWSNVSLAGSGVFERLQGKADENVDISIDFQHKTGA